MRDGHVGVLIPLHRRSGRHWRLTLTGVRVWVHLRGVYRVRVGWVCVPIWTVRSTGPVGWLSMSVTHHTDLSLLELLMRKISCCISRRFFAIPQSAFHLLGIFVYALLAVQPAKHPGQPSCLLLGRTAADLPDCCPSASLSTPYDQCVIPACPSSRRSFVHSYPAFGHRQSPFTVPIPPRQESFSVNRKLWRSPTRVPVASRCKLRWTSNVQMMQ